MFIVLLKIKEKIYFENLESEQEMIDYIDTIESKFGDIEYDKSTIISGNKKEILTLVDKIEDEYYNYIVGRKIDSKVYDKLLKLIESSKLQIKIKYGIEFEVEDSQESHNPISLTSDSLESVIDVIDHDEQYTINFLIYPSEIVIGVNLVGIKENYLRTKSFNQTFDNLDEALSLFEGFKHDFMEIIDVETEISFTISTMLPDVINFIENKINLMDWKETQIIKYLDGSYKQEKVLNESEIYTHDDFLTAREVMRMLRISDQTLANWRKNNLIKFRKISNRKFLYFMDSVQDIFENGIDSPCTSNSVKLENSSKQINYELEIIKMLKPIAYKIPEYKRDKQNYFLNFGNIGLNSSPQVMINNNFQLVDFIKKTIIKTSPKELYEYLVDIFKEGKQPRLDTSKRIQPEYSKFYLNKLFYSEI